MLKNIKKIFKPVFTILSPSLKLGNSVREAPASRFAKLELRPPGSQSGDWEPAKITPKSDWTLMVTTTDGMVGWFDVRPYLAYEAFDALKDTNEFMKISNGGYFVEWQCGADLSADTIEAKMTVML